MLRPRFDEIALIDFAFSLVSGERLDIAAADRAARPTTTTSRRACCRRSRPGAPATSRPTRQLDWRCDLFSLAAMLWRYLPEPEDTTAGALDADAPRQGARAGAPAASKRTMPSLPTLRPHAELIALASEPLAQPGLRESLQRGWTLALDSGVAAAASPTPVTRIAAPIAPAMASTAAATRASIATPVIATPAVAAPMGARPLIATPVVATPVVPTPVIETPLTSPWPRASAVAQAAAPDASTASVVSQAAAPDAATPVPGRAAAEPSPPPAATWFASASASHRPSAVPAADLSGATAPPLAVDPSDVALRMLSRQRQREQRVRRIAWTSGVAGVAVSAAAAVAWLAPSWLSWRATRDLQVAAAPVSSQSPGRADPVVAFAAPRAAIDASAMRSSPGRSDGAGEAGATNDGAAKAGRGDANGTSAEGLNAEKPASRANVEGANAEAANPEGATTPAAATEASPAKALSTAPSAALTVPATVPAARSRIAMPLRDGSRAPVRASATPPAPPAAARQPPGARPVPAPTTRLARASTSTSAPRGARPGAATSLRVAASPVARPPALANPWPGDVAPIPWAVAGRTAPRLAPARSDPPRLRGAPATTRLAAAPVPSPRRPESPSLPIVGVTSRATTTNSGAPATAEASPPTVAVASARSANLPEQVPSAAALTPPARAPAPSPAGAVGAPIDYASRADDLMAHQVPRLAQRAERLVARVLFAAGRSANVPGDETIRAAAGTLGHDAADALADLPVSVREAQRLGEAARSEYARRGGTPEALALQARAFGANPLDAEAAGNLAFLLLRQRPAQAEAARQLALLALTLPGTRQLESRIEDWATLAIASALSGRERDSRNAFLVALSLASNLERQCKAALDVYALYGERLRAPVEAMLQSASASGRSDAGPFCEGPAQRLVSGSVR